MQYRTIHCTGVPFCLMTPRSPLAVRQHISQQLRRFLARHPVSRLFVAQGTLAPPSLAYMVSFTRLSVTLGGLDPVEMELNGEWKTVRLRRGDALFVPPNIANRPTWSGTARVLTILFGARHTGISLVSGRRSRGEAPVAIKAQFDTPADSPARAMLTALTAVASTEPANPACVSLVQAILHCSSSLLDRAPPNIGSKANRTYQSLCLYAQEHFHLPLSRESVSEHFGLSPNHVSRLFRQQGLMTFGDYLNWVRIDRAKLMLKRHGFALEEIAERCGFNQVSYFCRVFKARTKLTPTQYRLGNSPPPLPRASRAGAE